MRLLYGRQLLQGWSNKHVGLLASGISIIVLASLPRQLLNLPAYWLTWTAWTVLLLGNCWMTGVALCLWRDYLLRLQGRGAQNSN
ncbi:hypothetical protein KLP40_14420 [Hymenobacter sp. NST-14]|uniref:hypothetical protein n=1 Tax=Hymenobacter piscis TaxID=2839984 RepID=UPI001C0140E9|nr:hypothetical protein [Hymenobacter piscis]MBT9394362.1 hypothetical protein [Hymenobacter piscis]